MRPQTSLFVSIFLCCCFCSVLVHGYNKLECLPGNHAVKPSQSTTAPETFTVHWMTTMSDTERITMEVTRAWSPLGADRFYALILDNFYNCAGFFRVVPGFVVQFGIASDPQETQKWDKVFRDDPHKVHTNAAGTVSFASAGANTRTTQLFVNYGNNANLDSMGFTPFGQITEGLDLLKKVYNPTPKDSGGANQGLLTKRGNKWLLKHYPAADIITSTELVLPADDADATSEQAGTGSSNVTSPGKGNDDTVTSINGGTTPVDIISPNETDNTEGKDGGSDSPSGQKNGQESSTNSSDSESSSSSSTSKKGSASSSKAVEIYEGNHNEQGSSSSNSRSEKSHKGKPSHHGHMNDHMPHKGHHGSDDGGMHDGMKPPGTHDKGDQMNHDPKVSMPKAATPQQAEFSVSQGFIAVVLLLELALLVVIMRVK